MSRMVTAERGQRRAEVEAVRRALPAFCELFSFVSGSWRKTIAVLCREGQETLLKLRGKTSKVREFRQ